MRRLIGSVLAPAAFVSLLVLPMPGLSPEAHRLAAVLSAVVVLWVTEALPLPVTALLGASACVVLQVAPAKEVFAPFADPLMFLFIGAFILARGIFLHGLDRRLAYAVLSLPWVGARPSRILLALGAATALLSAWISNTATIGGLATPVGTPPNLIGLGFIRSQLGVDIAFFRWMLIGVPVVVLLFLFLYAYLRAVAPAGVTELPAGAELIRRERALLGPWTPGQRSVALAFGLTIALWVAPGIVAVVAGEGSPLYQGLTRRLPEGVAALLGAAALFVLPGKDGPAITWSEATRIDWGVVLLYGGGFALGVLSFQTGLAEAMGRGLTGLLPVEGRFGLLVASVLFAAILSETTSNTASANMVVPVVISIARASGMDPLEPALGATLGSSLGFMLPVSTPCNAIVYGSGYIPLGRMIRWGLALDLVGVIVIVCAVRTLSHLVR